MWFKRKNKNRRFERAHVLDVKLRSSQVRATRTRLAAIALGVSFGTLFGLYLCWRAGEWALDTFIYENKSFAIQKIDIQTDGNISTDQLRRWSGIKPGQNLLALDLSRVKRDLELEPTIQSVSVERILPRTLRVRVTEREPVAQIQVLRSREGGGFELVIFMIDAKGWVMLPLDPRQRSVPLNQANENFPVISGINPTELQPGRQIESRQLQAALDLIDAFERSPMAGLVDLKRIDVSSPEILVAKTGQGSEITFALQDLEKQLRRWREIYDYGFKMNKVVATLDLAVPNNIPANWLEAGTVPPVVPKQKPPRTKRKNV